MYEQGIPTSSAGGLFFVRASVAVVLILHAPNALAQPGPDAPPAPDTLQSGHRGLMVGGGYLLALSQGRFAEAAGAAHGGGGIFVAIQGERVALGIDASGFALDRRKEAVRLESGPEVALETTTDIVRVSLFGRYGPRFGSVYPYVEVLAGANMLTTTTKLAGAPDDAQGDREKVERHSCCRRRRRRDAGCGRGTFRVLRSGARRARWHSKLSPLR